MALEEYVEVAFLHARENGFYFVDLTDREIAEDMQMCDPEIEPYSIEAITKAVTKVRAELKERL